MSNDRADQIGSTDGQAVLLYQNLPAARVRLLPWYADRRCRHLRNEEDRS